MATSNDKRLDDLEKKTQGSEQIKVSINWCEPGFILDEDTGEEVTAEEWRKRHPDQRLKIVTWDDNWDDSPAPVLAG